MIELSQKEKAVALEMLKIIRDTVCLECKALIDQVVLKIAYS